MSYPGAIDLHMHTCVSDGTDTPKELLLRVKKAGIELFSVTDHDAVKACAEIKKLLKKGDPAFVSGVEFSCKDEEGKYHILGYAFDPDAEPLVKTLEKGHSFRVSKVRKRLDFLKEEYGFSFSDEDISELFSLDNPGKPHIGNLMVKYGYAEKREDAIKNYIDKYRAGSEYVRPEEAIEAILGAGGVPVLAHPAYGRGDELILGDELLRRVRRLTGFGLLGLEAFYSGFTRKLRDETLALAEVGGLYVTAGSEYHGKNKIVNLGDTDLPRADEFPKGLLRFLDRVCPELGEIRSCL